MHLHFLQTFSSWVKFCLHHAGVEFSDFQADFVDGLKLIKLLQVVTGEALEPPEPNPTMRV